MILCGDARELPLADGSVSAIVCDPPYGLGFMGKAWDKGVPGVPFWTEARRVAKPGAHLLAFGGARTYHRLTCAIEDAGWEIRDCLMWLYGQGWPKHESLLKPAYEPVVLARAPFRGSVASNVVEHGTGVLNIEASRVGTESVRTSPRSDLLHAKSGSLNAGAWSGRVDTSPRIGRWPANLLHDGSDEVVGMFPDAKGQQGAVTGNEPSAAMGAGSCYGAMEHRHASTPRGDSGSAARFYYAAKASRAEREAGLQDLPPNDKGRRNTHNTVKPVSLMRYLVRLVTPPSGLVLDNFAGSGSTGCGCAVEDFEFVGVELDPKYAAIAERRIAWHVDHRVKLLRDGSGAYAGQNVEAENPRQGSLFE